MSLVLLSANAGSMTTAGYPAIATVGGTFIFAYTLYYAAAKTGYGGWRNHAVWFFFNLLLWLFGLFLVFGPDQLVGVNINGTNTGGAYGNGVQTILTGPRAAIIGLQLMVQASVGVFAIYSANAYAALVFGFLGIFNELCLIGSLFFFNYNQPIWLLDPTECNLYFKGNYLSNITRCHDTGYLEFLRIIGVFEILINGLLIVISLLAYATAVPAAFHPANTGAAGAPYGTTNTTAAPGAYNAGPSYGTATAGPGFVAQQGAMPVNTTTTTMTQPTYTTTTAPTQQYTTTAAPTTTHL